MGLPEESTGFGTRSSPVSKDTVAVPDRALRSSSSSPYDDLPDLPDHLDLPDRRDPPLRVPRWTVLAALVLLLVCCLPALLATARGHRDTRRADGGTPTRTSARAGSGALASSTGGTRPSATRSGGRTPTPSASRAARTASSTTRRTGTARKTPVPGPGSASRDRSPATGAGGRATGGGQAAGPTGAADDSARQGVGQCSVAVLEGIPQSDPGLIVLFVRNSGPVTLRGWTLAFSLPAGSNLVGAQNVQVVSSGPSAVRLGNLDWNGPLVPGEGADIVLTTTGGDRSAGPRGLTCSTR